MDNWAKVVATDGGKMLDIEDRGVGLIVVFSLSAL